MASGSRAEHVTATGIRFVGREAAALAERSEEQVAPGRDDDVLFAARFVARARLGGGSGVTGILGELGRAIARDWQDAPPLTRERGLSRRSSRFAGLTWEVDGAAGAWMGELLWRHPHPVVSGAPCTTHVVIEEHGAQARLAVRVTADRGLASVRGMVGAGQARPAFLTGLNAAVRLTFDGGDGEPRPMDALDMEAFVRDVLLDEHRAHPVAVQAPLEEGGWVVPPTELADALLGLAPLYFMERHPTTFRLTDALGDRRLSAYWGALRVYLPGFTCADRPDEHFLLVRDQLIDPVLRAEMLGRLGRMGLARNPMPAGVAARRAPPAASQRPAVAGTAADSPPGVAVASGASAESGAAPPVVTGAAPVVQLPPELLALGGHVGTLAAAVGELRAELARLAASNAELASEVARLRTAASVRVGSNASLERRLGSLAGLLERHLFPSPPEDGREEELPDEAPDEGALTLVDVVRQAATAYPDALLILETAERSAAESPYEDPERVEEVLDAMAQVARRRQEGGLGAGLRQAFKEFGVDYRSGIAMSTSRRDRQQYRATGADGRVYECEEHIALGSTYDPRRCLRIYFTSRAPVEPRFVIGHVGRHLRVITTT